MTIKAGDRLPEGSLFLLIDGKPTKVPAKEVIGDGRVVIFALPGAFTPTCSAAHLPGFVVQWDELRKQGVDRVVCLSVNDAWVMDQWGQAHNVEDRIIMAADGTAEYSRALGLEVDLSVAGMGVRSQRYAMIVDDGVVTKLLVEQPGKFEVSSADSILQNL